MKVNKIIASLLTVIILTGTALATTGEKNVAAYFDDIKIVLNGEELSPKDATGATVEPFTIDGTTYLPVRAVGEALGLEVEWDSETKTVILTESSDSDTIYRTATGKRYHYNPNCNGTYYATTLEEALAAGLTPCEKCVLKNDP